MAESVKVPKEEFERVIRALLNTPPTPLAEIRRKRGPKDKNRLQAKRP